MSFNPVNVTFMAVLDVLETISPTDGNVSPPGGSLINHNGFDTILRGLNAQSNAWPVSGCGFVQVVPGNGTVTIDLTALAVFYGVDQFTKNANGLKVRAIVVQPIAGNTNPVTIQPGAANPYNLDGASFLWSQGITGGRAVWLGNDAPTIGAGAKTLLFTGTHAADGLNVGFVFG